MERPEQCRPGGRGDCCCGSAQTIQSRLLSDGCCCCCCCAATAPLLLHLHPPSATTAARYCCCCSHHRCCRHMLQLLTRPLAIGALQSPAASPSSRRSKRGQRSCRQRRWIRAAAGCHGHRRLSARGQPVCRAAAGQRHGLAARAFPEGGSQLLAGSPSLSGRPVPRCSEHAPFGRRKGRRGRTVSRRMGWMTGWRQMGRQSRNSLGRVSLRYGARGCCMQW